MNMQELNLSYILRLFGKHTPYMLIILISSYFLIPFVYSLDKVYVLDTAIVYSKLASEPHSKNLLNKATVEALLGNKDFATSLSLSSGNSDNISKFKPVYEDGSKHLSRVRFYGDNIDDILNTSSLVINELRKIEKNNINSTLQLYKRQVELNNSIINDLEEDANKASLYYVIDDGNVNPVLLEDDLYKRLAIDLEIGNLQYEYNLNSYKEISYVSPINKSSITQVLPGKLVHIGSSILAALLYFLIVINYHYSKLRK